MNASDKFVARLALAETLTGRELVEALDRQEEEWDAAAKAARAERAAEARREADRLRLDEERLKHGDRPCNCRGGVVDQKCLSGPQRRLVEALIAAAAS